MTRFSGGCHCGAVRFEVELAESASALECNCSICAMCGFLHLIAPQSRFQLTAGQDSISEYRFNSGQARHYFCKVCGIKPYYIPRSNPDGVSVNLRCLDNPPPDIGIEPFDGQNWEQNAASLRHLSESED